MRKIRFRFGHLTAGEQTYECSSADIVSQMRTLVDELYESDDGHYQVYFANSDNSGLTICQSGLLIYNADLSNPRSVYYAPDSRDTIYEIVLAYLAGDIGLWLDKFQATAPSPTTATDLFDPEKKGKADYPLHQAVLDNDLPEVTAILRAGHNIESLDNKRCTPLILAANQGRLKICKYLIKKGANIHVKDNWGNSIFDFAEDYPAMKAYFKTLRRQ